MTSSWPYAKGLVALHFFFYQIGPAQDDSCHHYPVLVFGVKVI